MIDSIAPNAPSRPAEAAPLIQLRHVTRFYGTVIGVNDLDLELPVGSYGLVGPNGAGKTTLLGMLTGTLRPSQGSVRVFGKNPWRHDAVMRRIGYCPANDLLLPRVSAYEWLVFLLRMHNDSRQQAREKAEHQLALVGLKDRMHHSMGTYSLGMRQRAKLAQALAHDPDLLILDEPFNGLDPVGRHDMGELLHDWAARGRSLLLASHVLHEVESVCQSYLLIYGGRLLAWGASHELRTLLADIPQEITLRGSDALRLAPQLVSQPWLEQLTVDEKRQQMRLAVREPLALYHLLTEAIAREQLDIRGITGEEEGLAGLFRVLTSRHQGQHV